MTTPCRQSRRECLDPAGGGRTHVLRRCSRVLQSAGVAKTAFRTVPGMDIGYA